MQVFFKNLAKKFQSQYLEKFWNTYIPFQKFSIKRFNLNTQV